MTGLEKMLRKIAFACAIFLAIETACGRVYYIDNSESVGANDLAYPSNHEQSSRDLDLSFSAGNPSESDARSAVQSVKKEYVVPERSLIEINKEMEPSPSYYKIIQVPERRRRLKEIFVNPEDNRKLIKENGDYKGEVILELRVIANSDDRS